MARFGSSDGSGKPGDDPTRSTQYTQRGPQPPGPQPAPFGPPGPGYNPGDPGYHPGNAPTQYNPVHNPFEQQIPGEADTTDFAGVPPTPWFRRRSVLTAWFGLIAVMLGLVIWGIVQLTSRGPGGGSTAPQTSSSSSTSTTTSSSATTSSSTSESPSSTSAPPAAPPGQAPPQQPAPRQPPVPSESHRHLPRLPSLPSVITIPPIPKVPELPTVITIPPRR
ncbi:hypothetical protein MTER_37240 [Mycolicibacter terrae]|uniref:Uncharacterized protein n=1 Tax=Mycolicibacter terrae TaxID=1788 RepID=A0AAD1MIA0_9MYCO|nr:hypothetical protein [Mycolicibacter terrae]ORW93576.1 hypothetical protein AWC28_15965 [Mycolicibacter terrae]BBX24313.1 hypothetical protein MTER_37240 [Mycolicibacter terrae]SNV54425.1 Uncharacterized protein conserved in bacteria [Mycolicibacter terrae]